MPLQIYVHEKPVILTDETLDKTWAWFADNCRACARDALAGKFYTNNPAAYASDEEARAGQYDRREGRMSLTFIQRAYFIQTGESVPLLA